MNEARAAHRFTQQDSVAVGESLSPHGPNPAPARKDVTGTTDPVVPRVRRQTRG